MCDSHDETAHNILCSYPKQIKYKKRHDVVERVIHWELCEEYGVECSDNWFEHSLKSVEENEEVILLQVLTIQTNREIHYRRPDIVIQKRRQKKQSLWTWLFPGVATYCRKKLKSLKVPRPGKRDFKDLEIKDNSGASGSRCIGFSVKEAGRPLGATRN